MPFLRLGRPSVAGAVSGLSKRSVLNVNNFSSITNEYAFIDHIKSGTSILGPSSNAFSSTTDTFGSLIDENGWVNSNSSTGTTGGGFQIPDPANFAGPYVLDLPQGGNGVIILNITDGGAVTFSTSNNANCSVTFSSSGPGGQIQITTTGGASAASIQVSLSGTSSGPQSVQFRISTTGTSGFFIKQVRFYRLADQTDLVTNGKIFRTAWKQPIVDYCPSAVRTMNIHGGNANLNCRFENRTLPTNAGYCANSNWVASPAYGAASGTNQYTLAAATPTAGNPKNTPASMQHGELATIRFTNGVARATNQTRITGVSSANPASVSVSNPITVTSISNGTPAVVTYPNTRFDDQDVGVFLTTTGTLPSPLSPSTVYYTKNVQEAIGVPGSYTTNLALTRGGAAIATTTAGSGTHTINYAHGYSTGDQIIHLFYEVNNTGGTLSNGSPTVTNINNSSIVAGMFVYGPGIPANTTVVSINSGASTLLMSANATLSADVGLAFRAMPKLHRQPCLVTSTGLTTYTIQTLAGVNIDGSTLGTFSTSKNPITMQYTTLQVGSGNDRIAYPLVFADGSTPVSIFGNGYIRDLDYKTCYFDKTVSAITDGSGNPVTTGVWMMEASPGNNNFGHSGDFPIEVLVAMVNELNAMSPAKTIGLWVNIPVWGLTSVDPDYTTASDWALNTIDVIMNPSSSVRAAGFSALGYSGASQLNTPNLIVEYSNELWPSGTNGNGRAWLQNQAILRWPTIMPYQNWQDMKGFRSTVWSRAITAANPPGLSRIYPVIGMWGTFGLRPGDGAGNYATAFGGTNRAIPYVPGDWYSSDATVIAGGWGRPIDNHQGVCPANYFDAPTPYMTTTTGTGTYTDDSAMFQGLDNTSNGGSNYSGAANPSQAITNFIAKVVDAAGTYPNEETVHRFTSNVMPEFSATMTSLAPGKSVVNYEGGPNWPTLAGTRYEGYVLTAGDQTFMLAIMNSSQLATMMVNAFDAFNAFSNCYMPSQYLWIEGVLGYQRWADASPDTYATILGTPTEGAALTVNSPQWIAKGVRNRALSV